jgi:hypothetical protein
MHQAFESSETKNIEVGVCPLLGYYAPSSGNLLRTFWENLSVPSSGVKKPKKLKLENLNGADHFGMPDRKH